MAHVPVLLTEIVTELQPVDDALYVDATFGRGGVTQALLEAADCHVVGIDCDPDAGRAATSLARQYAGRFRFLQARFGGLVRALARLDVRHIDGGIIFDLGVSSPQLDDPERGFSFRRDGPLDMRMGRSGQPAATTRLTPPPAPVRRSGSPSTMSSVNCGRRLTTRSGCWPKARYWPSCRSTRSRTGWSSGSWWNGRPALRAPTATSPIRARLLRPHSG